jgi:NitT/TauT family transport system ATP-binding protein
MESTAKIEAKQISKKYGSDTNQIIAIENLDLTIHDREFAVIVGPSGCGKSTFLNLIAGFEKTTEGEIFLDGKLITAPGPDRGIVFQEYCLYPWRTVLGNIKFGLEIQKNADIDKIALTYLKLVGLEGFENAYPYSLSGGMKQRVAIARALAYNPSVLLMDEPFASLDAQTKKIMQEELLRIWNETKKTIVYVTHSVIEAVYLADRIVILTARPARIKKIIEINLPRPRSYVDGQYLRYRTEVLTLLDEEVKKTRTT